MDVPFLLSEVQMRRIEPFFPLSHGVPRVDDRRIVSAIIYVIKHGLMVSGVFSPRDRAAGARRSAMPGAHWRDC